MKDNIIMQLHNNVLIVMQDARLAILLLNAKAVKKDIIYQIVYVLFAQNIAKFAQVQINVLHA